MPEPAAERDEYVVPPSLSRSGPLVWASIIGSTCLLLFFFQKILWLVVPCLLALLIYYSLLPIIQRLVLAGFSIEGSATLVSLVAFALIGIVLLIFAPAIAARVMHWEDWLGRYLEGGMTFINATLKELERNFAVLAHARISDGVRDSIAEFSTTFVARHLSDALVTVAAWLPSLLLAPFLAFFFLRDGRRFRKFLLRSVPNAFFERTVDLLEQVDRTTRLYFQGLLKLTLLDAACLALGLSLLGVSGPLLLGLITAVLAWVPYVGSILGCGLVVLVVATDFPGQTSMAYGAIALFLLVRLLDDFVFMPLTIGRSLRMHPLLTVLMIFIGGAVAGVSGLMLVLPLLGVVMVIGETIGQIITDPRLQARHAYALSLKQRRVTADL